MEIITGGGQHGVNGIAGMVCKIIAAHAVLGLEMTFPYSRRAETGTHTFRVTVATLRVMVATLEALLLRSLALALASLF
jgi:hypothetical protein